MTPNQYTEFFKNYLEVIVKDVIDRTGREDLWPVAFGIGDRDDEIIKLIDTPAGVELAETALEADERQLDEEQRPKLEKARLELKAADHLGRAGLVQGKLNRMRLEELLSNIKGKTLTESDPKLDKLLEDIHIKWVRTIDSLLADLGTELPRYRRSKLITALVPRIEYLLFTLLILTIGVGMIGDRIEDASLKFGFAIAVWAVQEFILAPRIERWKTHNRQQQLKKLARKLTLAKFYSTFMLIDIENDLNKKLDTKP
jgi:hypothetical protein